MQRRDFIKAGLGLSLLACLPVKAQAQRTAFFSCRADTQGRYFISGIDRQGQLQLDIALPGRGHGMQLHPQRPELLVFSRRPGTFLWVVDLATQQVSHKITSPAGRHFYGHGSFSRDGRYLFTTENEYETARGVIAVYDSHDHYRRLDEFDSHGIGPHELVTLNQANVLAVANGGIQTHPDFQRTKLNLDSMDPSLAYIDLANGQLLDAYRPPAQHHQLSIRHLSLTHDDTLCIAMQYEGAANEHPPLIAMHKGEDKLQFVELPEALNHSLNNYCGSVCTDSSNEWFAISAPRGGRIIFIDTHNSKQPTTLSMQDGCGITSGTEPGEFYISSGDGSLLRYRVNGTRDVLKSADNQVKWDNHMI